MVLRPLHLHASSLSYASPSHNRNDRPPLSAFAPVSKHAGIVISEHTEDRVVQERRTVVRRGEVAQSGPKIG
ncbi:hypothetical protein PsYK624_119110 [Phanerochaete sordida]|uniref:Uncharacterized protein n=1 Tax=Phanerochaete sordida TaxID=48140 RepID=A0A9P3LHV3_9APHY|nr:hypothetical protein PsYK624_119110 [Phanerochaete sordida]